MGSPIKNWSKLLTADQLPSESFVMPGVSCKTMFNNELWTSEPPISRWSAGRRWCEWCYRYRHRRYDYERYEKRSETLVASERSRRSPSAANACFLVERTSSPCGMSALGH